MFLSKHHYAVELARRGCRVYFVDPPRSGLGGRSEVTVEAVDGCAGLHLVRHRLFFPADLRFHLPGLYEWLLRRHVCALLAALPEAPDMVWSFDQNNLYPLALFPEAMTRVFFPFDAPQSPAAFRAARGAQAIFSVAPEILEAYARVPAPRHLLGHGVAEAFFDVAPWCAPAGGQPVRVGLSGNFTRTFIDFPVLLDIIRAHPDVIFECWGSYRAADSNIGGGQDHEVGPHIEALATHANVVLHGAVPTETLAHELSRMDAFLICYDVPRDQSHGTNYHKVLEYLATGRVVISSHITAYTSHPELVAMVDSRTDNRALPALFQQVLASLPRYNAPERQAARRAFAQANTYGKKIEAIGAILAQMV